MQRFLGIFITIFICQNVNAFTQTLVFTEQELQQRLNEMTPLQRQTLYANIVLTDAALDLLEGANQLAITAYLDATVLGGFHGSGSISIQGSLRYNAEEGAFYLHQAEIVDLHIDQLKPDIVKQLKPLIADIMIQALKQQPIYRLNDADIRQSLLKTTLKDIQIENDQVKVSLGF